MIVHLALLVASLFYVLGGIAMKSSEGFKYVLPSVLVLGCFCVGSTIQNWAMKSSELGTGYVLVLGLEAVLAVAAGAIFLSESITALKVAGTVAVVIGMVLLKI